MTDKKDETGKGPAKPGDAPRRPYATIDLQATEVAARTRATHPQPGQREACDRRIGVAATGRPQG